jgi:hypothetical protein
MREVPEKGPFYFGVSTSEGAFLSLKHSDSTQSFASSLLSSNPVIDTRCPLRPLTAPITITLIRTDTIPFKACRIKLLSKDLVLFN